jgi:spore germination cell wall hydrolase CwlJ-like protein
MKWLTVIVLIIFSNNQFAASSSPHIKEEINMEEELYVINLPEIEVKAYNQQDLMLLAKLVNSEDGGQPLLSNAVVAQTVLKKAARYGSIKKAVYKTYTNKDGKKSYAYYGVLNSVFKKDPPQHIVDICSAVLKGWRPAPESVEYFIGSKDPNGAWKRHISKYAWKQIGYHTYCHNPKYVTND